MMNNTQNQALKVLYILRGNEYGGIASAILSVSRAQEIEGVSVSFLLISGKGKLYKKIKKMDFAVRCIGIQGFHPIKITRKIISIIKEGKYNLIHTHSMGSNLYGRLAKLCGAKIPLVTTVHADTYFTLKSAFENKTIATLIYYFDLGMSILSNKIITVSHYLKGRLIANGIREKKITVVENVFDANQSNNIGNDNILQLKKSLCIPLKNKVIGNVGRLSPVKNIPLLLNAFKEVNQKLGDVTLVIIGGGKLEKELKDLTKSLDIDKNVIFTNWRDDVVKLYNVFDIYVQTSLMEGSSMTTLEAWSCGKPVIATAVGAILEMVEDNHTGILVQSGDVSGLSKAIINLLQNQTLSVTMGEKGRKEVFSGRFRPKRGAKQLVDIYSQLCSKHTA